ncbi:MAG: hypothetical protein QM675_08005 [Protaetiibacter sp.]
MRRSSALVSSLAVVAVLAATLAGCAAASDDASACTPALSPGSASELVTATGDAGTQPTVSIPAPLVSTTSQRSVLSTGTGIVAQDGMTVDIDAVLLDGSDGTLLDATAYDTSNFFTEAGADGAMYEALVCAQPGTRIAVTSQLGDSGLNVTSTDESDLKRTVVIVIDVIAVYLGKADGVNQLPLDGMPTVVTAPDGTPGITVLDGEPPAETRVATIKAGGGARVADGDDVVLHTARWSWTADGLTTGTSTWDTVPYLQSLADDASDGTSSTGETLPDAVRTALVGARVGSQLLVVVPVADTDGTADVLVIDVLGIQATTDTK